MKKENHGSTVQIFIVVDQDSGMAYALKVRAQAMVDHMTFHLTVM